MQNNKNNEVIDLSNELEDSNAGDEDQASDLYYPGTPKIIQWMIKYSGGFIKNERQASYILIGFLAVSVIIIMFLFFNRNGAGQNMKPYHPNTRYGGKKLPDNVR